MNPRHPVYIVSKGRWESRMTARTLDLMGVPYFIVVEAHEHAEYAAVIEPQKILTLDQQFLADYDTLDNVGESKSKGPEAARNFCWAHAIASGATWHWVLDDNINGFVRLNHNERIRVNSGAMFAAAEDFAERYENVAQAGFEYRFFAGGGRREKAPYRTNTRIYSCILIRNDIPFRWRGRYNEDTILSLDILTHGYATILFQAFLQNKAATQTVKGGNSKDFYDHEGTRPKSEMLVKTYPMYSHIVTRYGRCHHHVDYSSFQQTKLIRRKGFIVPEGINNYGMVLKSDSNNNNEAEKETT